MNSMFTLDNGYNIASLDQNSTFLSKFAHIITPTMGTKNHSSSVQASKRMVKAVFTLDMQALKVDQTAFWRKGR